MALPNEKLAASLAALKTLQDRHIVALRSSDLSRTHRERLVKSGFLQEVMKGWYIPSNPQQRQGETTSWYASFWDFCASYLGDRFGNDWCIAPEPSLSFHAGNRTVPQQLLVRSPAGGNKPTALLYGTSIFDTRASMPAARDVTEIDGLRLYALPSALVEVSPGFFTQRPTDARTALAMFSDASDILKRLLEGGHTTIAGRLAGAFRNIGRERIADDIVRSMRAADFVVRETDPFDTQLELTLPRRETSPYAGRIRLMWQEMRGAVIDNLPEPPGRPNDVEGYLHRVDDVYATDAYHSLSIEGYRVSPGLIDRVRSGTWNPDRDAQDGEHREALAARGYYQAFEAVKRSVTSVLANENPGRVVDEDHGGWYRELFAPSVTAGIVKPADLAGYRSERVFIRNSMHVPLPPNAVRDAMPVFFEMLEQEEHPAVRVVLGHFIFVYIHPFMDGNGRMGRFLMNVMMAAGGYPWTVIPVQRRADYMAALERASTHLDIVPFAGFIGELVRRGMSGERTAELPAGTAGN
ncbi:MAG: Fic family protein [Mesorhizobium sp.]|uniref:Fic family protein n=1 Tax=Mesorhizobium sp. TaxID=1871066 RepID=UPI000FE76D08|nr:Fic family protein [Mesorhizobium sp.]RWD59748.1 MAG: Fic family protein [Mesorhizobium sp.]RWE31834.1 MAG: Fic family protein [Mesorhizobium sp.]